MPVLLSCESIAKTYGSRRLFDNLSLAISDGERLGLIGPNGSGKSTLMEILCGAKDADAGTVSARKLTRIGYVPQDSFFPADASVRAVLDEAASNLPLDTHEREALIAETIGRAGFASDSVPANSLSGGWRKRLAIATQLVRSPDVLLLDEPTNHLDFDGILWLERLLTNSRFASLVISHDRYFLENVATHMAEINRVYPGGLFYVGGNYSEFLEKREDFLHAQTQHQEALENRVRREVEWLRRGPKARTTKSKARIQDAGRLMGELNDVNARTRTGTAQIDFTASDRKTKRLLVAEGIDKILGGRVLFRNLEVTLRPGSRLGLVGPNGSGKTTLLKIFSGELEPDQGTVDRADQLKIVSFEQNRDVLDPNVTLRRSMAPEGDVVLFRERPIHVAGWAKRFLFQNEQLEMPVGSLSGGERARVLIARLMLQPADLLLLDEPTNDLDISTLEVLEDNLLDFPGALVLVTHDRYMLDRVSTTVLGLDGEGGALMYADYSQWEQDRSSRPARKQSAEPSETAAALTTSPVKKKLSYLEQREWEQIEERILEAEAELERQTAALHDPQIAADGILLQQTYTQMQSAQSRVDELYSRWAELEGKRG
jgi:ABC transport system ATP-binding/permease protein